MVPIAIRHVLMHIDMQYAYRCSMRNVIIMHIIIPLMHDIVLGLLFRLILYVL